MVFNLLVSSSSARDVLVNRHAPVRPPYATLYGAFPDDEVAVHGFRNLGLVAARGRRGRQW